MKEAKAECSDCGGAGLYIGIGERNGVAVVCRRCEGTGAVIIKWTPFTERHRRDDVSLVIESNPGVCVSSELDGFGGMPYDQWAAGKPFPPGSEMRGYTCPAWWYQCTNYSKKPNWDECGGGGTFYQCNHFEDKAMCWERWDRENP